MTELQDIAFLLATNPNTYAQYVKSILEMRSQAETAKLRLRFVTWDYQRELNKGRKTQPPKGSPR